MQAKYIPLIIGPITIIVLVVIFLFGPSTKGECIAVQGFGLIAKKGDVNCNGNLENENKNLPQLKDKPTNPEFIESKVENKINEIEPEPTPSLPKLMGEWYMNGRSPILGPYVGIAQFTADKRFVVQLNQYGMLSYPQYGSYYYDKAQNKITFNFLQGNQEYYIISNISPNSFTLSNPIVTIDFVKKR
jgi:hypothetical protein